MIRQETGGEYDRPERLERLVGRAYEDVLMVNEQVKNPQAVLDSLYYDLTNPTSRPVSDEAMLGRFASVAAAHEGDDELEGINRVHGELFSLVGLSIGVHDESIEIQAGGDDLAHIYSLVPDIEEADTFTSFIESLGHRGMYETPALYQLMTDTLESLCSRVRVVEENIRVFKRIGASELMPSFMDKRDQLLGNFRCVMPAYYNANFATLRTYRALEERVRASQHWS